MSHFADTMANSLKIHELSPFVAEVSGIDFATPEPPLEEIKNIFATYGVVIVRRNGPTTDEQLINFARHFGELDSVAQHRRQGIGESRKQIPLHP